MRSVGTILILLLMSSLSCREFNQSVSEQLDNRYTPDQAHFSPPEALGIQDEEYIHSQNVYADSSGKSVTIQNSLNKGGPLFGSLGSHYNHSFLVFFIRISND
ncbi:MAG: hypothetical protein HKO93_00670, partial [Flavobacteriales bacterium]|nr:hypothetical protein [Flavobacteriales bacterium]